MEGWGKCLVVVALFGALVSHAHGQIINSTACGDGTIVTWSTWDNWSPSRMVMDCSVNCITETGENFRFRNRTCPVKVNGCKAEQFEREYYECQGEQTAAQDGNYGLWSSWTPDPSGCNVLCGKGTVAQSRSRKCDNPEPVCGGSDCIGRSKETRKVGCLAVSCGRACSYYSPTTVLVTYSYPGNYLLCYRGSVYKLACPGVHDIPAYFKYGSTNASKMFRVCKRQYH